jgi:hypothetical protein
VAAGARDRVSPPGDRGEQLGLIASTCGAAQGVLRSWPASCCLALYRARRGQAASGGSWSASPPSPSRPGSRSSASRRPTGCASANRRCARARRSSPAPCGSRARAASASACRMARWCGRTRRRASSAIRATAAPDHGTGARAHPAGRPGARHARRCAAVARVRRARSTCAHRLLLPDGEHPPRARAGRAFVRRRRRLRIPGRVTDVTAAVEAEQQLHAFAGPAGACGPRQHAGRTGGVGRARSQPAADGDFRQRPGGPALAEPPQPELGRRPWPRWTASCRRANAPAR